MRGRFSHFDSTEGYTPVSDGNVKDLRTLDVGVITNVTTPTMLMTGVNDLRTPMEQTEQFYRALKLRTGLPLDSFASGGRALDKEIDLLVRRLARRG